MKIFLCQETSVKQKPFVKWQGIVFMETQTGVYFLTYANMNGTLFQHDNSS